MEQIAKIVTLTAVFGIPLFLLVYRFRYGARFKPLPLFGAAVDTTRLTADEERRFWALAPGVGAILTRHALLIMPGQGDFLIQMHTTDDLPHTGKGAIGVPYRAWPWQKRKWLLKIVFHSTKDGGYWYHYLSHELFWHLALEGIDETMNLDESDSRYSAQDSAAQGELGQLGRGELASDSFDVG